MSRRVILWACTADGLQSTVQDVNDLYACAAVGDGIVPLHLPLWNSHLSVAETWDVSRAQVVDNSTHKARNVRESFIQVSTLRPHKKWPQLVREEPLTPLQNCATAHNHGGSIRRSSRSAGQ